MRLPEGRALRWLFRKDARELVASRSYWLFLLVVGLLVGHAFLTSASIYAEVSGGGGGTAALSQGISPLDGIVVPVLGAYDIAATFLLPFVVIRLVASERQSGALKLLLQTPIDTGWMIAVKTTTLLAAWLFAMIPGAVALFMWHLHGGHLATSEVTIVVVGHLLLAAITIAVATAASGVSASSASAAIVALTFTLGTWAIDFMAEARGGLFEAVAQYTPTAVVRQFEHGELRLAVLLVVAALVIGGLTVGGITLDIGETWRKRGVEAFVAAVCAVGIAAGLARVHPSWDLSEDRRNSFAPADERALQSITQPLDITIHLAAQDPRLVDLDHEVLTRLERTVRHVELHYAASGRTGLFEQSADYGETVYQIGNRREATRSVSAPIVLETIYRVAGITPPANDSAPIYRGYPMKTEPAGIVPVFFIGWPVILIGVWMLARRRS